MWQKLQGAVLRHGSTKILHDTLPVMDVSDIQKKYGKKMEYATNVWDGSEKVIGKGYSTFHVISTKLEREEIIPLYHSLYSQDSPDFKSENEEILKAKSLVSSYTKKRGIWVIDSGADRERLFTPLLKGHHRFIIRLVGTQDLLYRRVPVNALKMALWCPCPYNDTIIRTEDGKEKSYRVRYDFLPVRLPNHPKTPLWLFVMRGLGAKPLMLLTTEPLRGNRHVLKNLLLSYIKRWSIEETIRFVKQTYDLENIRLLRYVCLKNMMALVLLVFYFLAVVLDTHQKLKILSGHVLDAAKRVFGIPDFKYYALGDGICAIFRRNPGRIRPKPPKPSVWQLSLKYT